MLIASSSVCEVTKQKCKQHHSAITTHIVVEGGTALVCEQPESLLRCPIHLVVFQSTVEIGYISRETLAGGRSPKWGLSLEIGDVDSAVVKVANKFISPRDYPMEV